MADGIVPLTLLFWMSNVVRPVKGVKLKWASVPVMFRLRRFICETVREVELQETAVHLQRLLRLERDHELRVGGEKDKVLFHWRRASACVLADDLAFKGNKERRRRWKRAT
jgi:hypothetical protein